MIIINFAAIILFLYLFLYFLYFLFISYCSSQSKIREVQSRTYETDYNHNLNLIIYSQNSEATVPALVDSIKKQDYPDDKYTVNVILDNCSDNTAKLLEIIGGTKLWRLNSDDGPKGKNFSIRWLLERIFLADTSDAYLILNHDISLKPDFLAKLNKELNKNDIVTGVTLNRSPAPSFINLITSFRKIFLSSVIFNGRNIAGLTNYLNEDFFAIKRETLKTSDYNFDKDSDYELEIPLRLINKGINVRYSTEMRVYKQYQENTENILKVINQITFSRFKLVKKYYKEIKEKQFNLRSVEFILSAFYPSEFLVGLLCYFLINYSDSKSYILGHKAPYFICVCYLCTVFYVAIVQKFDFKKLFLWLNWTVFSPAALAGNFVLNYKEILGIEDEIELLEVNPENPNSKVIDAILTDGDKELACKLELVSEDSLNQVIFRFNNKKLPSEKSLRMNDALQDIVNKLMEHGFALKVCQNCGYFEFDNKGRSSSDGGKCYKEVVKLESDVPESTNIWSVCDHIIPSHAKKFVRKELENLNKK